MIRRLSDGERALWNEQQHDAAPDWRTLSEREGIRRVGPIICDGCDEAIKVGDRYKTVSALEDGKFVQLRLHAPACPRLLQALAEGDGPPWAHNQGDAP